MSKAREWNGLNRRRFIRVKYPFTIHIYPSQDKPISAYTEDISEEGVGVTLKQELAVSSKVGLEIYLEPEPVTCRGEIVWTKKGKVIISKVLCFSISE